METVYMMSVTKNRLENQHWIELYKKVINFCSDVTSL